MRRRRKIYPDNELLPLPDGELTIEVLNAWVLAHEHHEPSVYMDAWIVGHLSQFASPGRPSRE